MLRPAALAAPALALAVAAALSGCAAWPLQGGADAAAGQDSPGGGWQRHACDPAGARGAPSANAALAEGLRREPAAIASDLAAALGDRLAAPLEGGDGGSYASWTTSRGSRVAVALRGGEFAMALYEGPAQPSTEALHALLVRWGVDPATLWIASEREAPTAPGPSAPSSGERLFQAELGWPTAWALGGLVWSAAAGQAGRTTQAQVAVLPFYDVAAPAMPLGDEAARQAALAFAACESGGGTGMVTGPPGELVGWGVLHGSLAYVAAVDVAADRCGDRWVYVDAGSGVVLGTHSEPCIG